MLLYTRVTGTRACCKIVIILNVEFGQNSIRCVDSLILLPDLKKSTVFTSTFFVSDI